ncbi:MAG: hypothetical protein MUO51_13200 [Woeseiaceae bacterium]|nr:hypothetical protein [Woeseiaceae bacterium]
MKQFWPHILIATGLFVILGGFIYDVIFAGIPYQDPTPEMSTRYSRHAHIASTIRWYGLGGVLFGALAGVGRCVVRRFRSAVVS